MNLNNEIKVEIRSIESLETEDGIPTGEYVVTFRVTLGDVKLKPIKFIIHKDGTFNQE